MIIADRNIVCVDWDERSLRVLDGQFRRGTLKVRKAVHVQLPANLNSRDPAEMGEYLKRVLGEHRIRTRRAIVDIPRQDAVFTLMPLPAGSVEELAAMVQVQAAKELPFSRDQAVVDFASGTDAKEGMCEVWVAAVRTAVVDRYRQAVLGAGLKLERVGLRPYANVASLGPDQAAAGRTLMVDIGPSMTEINVVADGRLVYSRAASVSLPLEGLDEKQKSSPASASPTAEGTIPLLDDAVPRPRPIESLLIEVSRTVEAYRATAPGSAINRVVLAGTVALSSSVVERFQQRFGVETRIYEAPPAVVWRRSKEMSTAPFSAVIGLALSSESEGTASFDFLHPKEPETVGRERQRRRPMLVATVAVFVLIAGVLAYHPIRQKKAEVQSLKDQISYLNRDSKARKELFEKLTDVQMWQAKNVVLIDKFARLSEAFTSNREGYITKLECSEKGVLSLELAVKDRMVATRLAASVADIKDAKGKQLYQARVGNNEDSRLPDYPIRDRVFIELEEQKKGS